MKEHKESARKDGTYRHVWSTLNLVGKTTNDADGKVPADGDKALFYDTAYDGAKISSLMDAGFNYQFSGVRMATSLTGAGSYQKLQ